jgi:hypothetical protein
MINARLILAIIQKLHIKWCNKLWGDYLCIPLLDNSGVVRCCCRIHSFCKEISLEPLNVTASFAA